MEKDINQEKENTYTSKELQEKFEKLVQLIQTPENYLPSKHRSYVRCDKWYMNDYSVTLTEESITLSKLDQNQQVEYSISKTKSGFTYKNITENAFMIKELNPEKVKTYRIR